MNRHIRRILLIDDDKDDYLLTRQMLSEAREGKFTLEWAPTYQAGEKSLANDSFDAVLVDYDLGHQTGIDLIRKAVGSHYPAPILLLTGRGTYEVDVAAMQAGAADYLSKSELNPAFLERAIRYAIDRKKNERELQAREMILREVNEKTAWLARFPDENPNPVVRISFDGLLLYQNPAASQLSGWNFVVGECVSSSMFKIIQKAIEQNHPSDVEHEIEGRYYSIAVTPFAGERYVNLYAQDVTKRVKAEKALRETEERFRIALSNTAIAVFSTDRDLRYTWFYCTPMNHMIAGIIGKRDDEILVPAHAAEFIDLKRRVLETRVSAQEELQLIVGELHRTLLVSVEPYLDHAGELVGVIGACYDITEQRRLEAESFDHLTEMEVHHRLLEYRERERQVIARDLHDGPVQDLSSLVFQLQLAKEGVLEPALRFEFDKIGLTMKQTIRDLRGMINELRPPSLIRFGITRAIQCYTDDFREKHPELEIELNLNPLHEETMLPDQVNLTLYRIYQEAMNNIIRHAQATQVKVRLGQVSDYVILDISDNGMGFPRLAELAEQKHNDHYGLIGMQERADAVGGSFNVNSEPGKGTSIHVTLPLSGYNQP
jgi:signal transduction histidine kinase/FixJ family two-component response regulator